MAQCGGVPPEHPARGKWWKAGIGCIIFGAVQMVGALSPEPTGAREASPDGAEVGGGSAVSPPPPTGVQGSSPVKPRRRGWLDVVASILIGLAVLWYVSRIWFENLQQALLVFEAAALLLGFIGALLTIIPRLLEGENTPFRPFDKGVNAVWDYVGSILVGLAFYIDYWSKWAGAYGIRQANIVSVVTAAVVASVLIMLAWLRSKDMSLMLREVWPVAFFISSWTALVVIVAERFGGH